MFDSRTKDNQIKIKQATTKPNIKKEPKIKFEPEFYDSDLSCVYCVYVA